MEILKAKLNSYRAFLADEQNSLRESIRKLEQEGRQDEANLNKVRLNIVNVFETVAAADEKAISADADELWACFLQRYKPRFDTLTSPWRARLEMACMHGDADTAAVEEAKLETAERIRSAFRSLEV